MKTNQTITSNLSEWSDEEINKAIATWCGWQKCPCGSDKCWHAPGSTEVYKLGGLPDFCNDLDEMHLAAMWLRANSPLSYIYYAARITEIIAMANSSKNSNSISALDATARQRAETFLRTLNDGKK